MKIRFKKGDPREGMVAEFDSSRGQELVDSGAAVEVRGEEAESKPAPKVAESKPAKKGK